MCGVLHVSAAGSCRIYFDSEKLGLITIHSANVHAVSIQPKTSEVKASKSKEVGPPGYQTSSRSTSATPPTVAPSPGKLTKAEILKSYAAQFKGRGYLGPPVHFKLNPDVTPIQMPVHRVPLARRKQEWETIQKYVQDGTLAKVEEPTAWCSNVLLRERLPTPTKPGKIRICIDPSQTVNKAIARPSQLY